MKNYICIHTGLNENDDMMYSFPAKCIYDAIQWYVITYGIDEDTEKMMYEMVKDGALDFFSYKNHMVSIFEEDDD